MFARIKGNPVLLMLMLTEPHKDIGVCSIVGSNVDRQDPKPSSLENYVIHNADHDVNEDDSVLFDALNASTITTPRPPLPPYTITLSVIL